MVRVAIKSLMKASPALPLGDSEDDLKKSMEKVSLFKNSTKQKNSVLMKTTYKLVNCDDFFREAHRNGYLERFTSYQKGINDRKLNYQQMVYEWSPHVIIAFWALMVCSKYYEWVPIDLTINNVQKKSVEDLFKTALSSDNAIRNSLRVHEYDPVIGTKTSVIDLQGSAETALNNVRDHVLSVAKFLCSNQTNLTLDWGKYFEQANFPTNYNTALIPVSNPLSNQFMKERADLEKVQHAVLNTFYPETATGEPVNDLDQMLTISRADLMESINVLDSVSRDGQKTPYEEKQLYDIVRRINRLKKN